MLSLFQRKRASAAAAPPPTPATDPPKGRLRPESAASLLATPRRQKLLEHIWQRTSLSRKQFATLYRMPLVRIPRDGGHDSMLMADSVPAVSYTHLTLPTNREV